MASNIKQAFNQKAIIPYVTLGDPSIEFTIKSCKTMIDAGADIIEIGLPFSDPIADGPVIQQSHYRALSSGEDVSIKTAFDVVRQLKQYSPTTPIIFMGATNLFLQYEYELFFKQAKQAQCDGVLLPDSSFEMSLPLQPLANEYDVDIIQLISPLCSSKRKETIMKSAQGFVYLLSSTGVTGERQSFAANLKETLIQLKAINDVPIAVGFGVSQPEHCTQLCSFADGVIIGSHFCKFVQSYLPNQDLALEKLYERIKVFKAAC